MSPDQTNLTPANLRDLTIVIATALQRTGAKRIRGAGEIMTQIVAEQLVDVINSTFVVMQPTAAQGPRLTKAAAETKSPEEFP